MQPLPGAPLPHLPIKIGDFGDQDDHARILCLNKRTLEFEACPEHKKDALGEKSKFINNTNEMITRSRPPP